MLPCHDCAYRRNIPGNVHIRCIYDWAHADFDIPKNHHGGRTNQWFHFPFNYDPVWGPDECLAKAETADPVKIIDDPLFQLLSLLK